MIHPLISELITKGPVLTDGAWGTQLQARGLGLGEFPDAWNLSNADKVKEVATAYVEAGSRVILSNTFGATRLRLAEAGLENQTVDINVAGARISKAAAGDRALVFASIGPCGKMLAAEEVTEDELLAAFVEQAAALATGGADGLVIETMSDLQEACLAVKAAKMTGLPVVASMVFDSGAAKDRTMMGITPEQAAEGLLAAGADVIGANCGQGIAGFIPLCERLRQAAAGHPVWIKANAGLPEIREGKAVYATGADQFASYLPALLQAGASFVGGCCGTSPEFIRVLRERLG